MSASDTSFIAIRKLSSNFAKVPETLRHSLTLEPIFPNRSATEHLGVSNKRKTKLSISNMATANGLHDRAGGIRAIRLAHIMWHI